MKNVLRIAAVAVALSFAGLASAQQTGTRVGIGVGLPTSELSSVFAGGALLPAQIYVPIDFSPNFRLEPEVGFVTSSQDDGASLSYYTLGAGAFYMMPLSQEAHMYVGGRLVIGWERQEEEQGGFTTKTSGTDLFLAGAFGGELLPHPRLGIGAEAQIGRWGLGDRETTVSGVGGSQTTPGGSSWQTQGIIFVRLYLN